MEKTNFEQLLRLIADMESFSKANDSITEEIGKIESESLTDDSLEFLYAAQAEPIRVPAQEEDKKKRR